VPDRAGAGIADVAFSQIYALTWMPSAAAAIVNSAFRPAGSTPNAEPGIGRAQTVGAGVEARIGRYGAAIS
jgi:hypothetical protein